MTFEGLQREKSLERDSPGGGPTKVFEVPPFWDEAYNSTLLEKTQSQIVYLPDGDLNFQRWHVAELLPQGLPKYPIFFPFDMFSYALRGLNMLGSCART